MAHPDNKRYRRQALKASTGAFDGRHIITKRNVGRPDNPTSPIFEFAAAERVGVTFANPDRTKWRQAVRRKDGGRSFTAPKMQSP